MPASTTARPLVCPYCQAPAALVGGQALYPHRPDLAARRFWLCSPCDAYVGCHAQGAPVPQRNGVKVVSDGTLPLGTLANAALRALRKSCHEVFDSATWKKAAPPEATEAGEPAQPPVNRYHAYKWLANQLCISPDKCHIAMFDESTCERMLALMRNRPPTARDILRGVAAKRA